MISDHQLSTSGVGIQSRILIHGLIATGKYKFICFGGAIRHENHDTLTVTPDFIIKPTDGFGTQQMIRETLVVERPDAMLLFTDPRFFGHVWSMEDEIHQICPIAYNHLWDQLPRPAFNDVLYESTDLINCINWPTYEMLQDKFSDRTHYIPHAVPPDMYCKMTPELQLLARRALYNNRTDRLDYFNLLFVSRNARRKCASDVLVSFKMFLDELEKKHGHRKATIVMHTDALDQEGPNLFEVASMLDLKDNIVFSKDKFDFSQMNALYNSCDAVINRSVAEGFGLSVLEAKMCEKPVIALKTGGLTRQVEDHETGFQYGVALEPEARSLVGNQLVPYIWEDYVTHETVADAIMTVYEMGPERRAEIGKLAREHCLKNYNNVDLIKKWDETLTKMFDDWDSKRLPNNKRWRHVEM